MCGIVASTNVRSGANLTRLGAAARRLRHRGPDGSGLKSVGAVGLAHERLAIIDVAGGSQPLASEDGATLLACNGEIYNHAALRADLVGRHAFASQSDSEVILHLYEERGPACVEALDGMFAFVITDGAQVLAARDPLGIKPLYMGIDEGGGRWFASEIKALSGLCPRIEAVPPGHLFTGEGGLRRWFHAPWAPPAAPAAPTGAFDGPTLAKRLGRAVEKRLMSDVPIGVFLSGGLDSSLIAALMRPHLDHLHSFSVGVEGAPDLAAARRVAEHLGTEHHELVYSPAEAVAVLETVIAHLESYDPALLRSAIPCFFVSRLAANYVKVVLSGEGADEAFAGYRYLNAIGDRTALQRELLHLLSGLHNINLQRVDRMTMAHALEARVPFLDVEFLTAAMAIDPQVKLSSTNGAEKWVLRSAFTGLLPDDILWRTKQEFAAGSGSEWILREYCDTVVTDAELADAGRRFPVDTPTTKEAYHYRHIYDQLFPVDAVRHTVGRWRGKLAPMKRSELHA